MIFNFFFLLGVKVRAGNESSRAESSFEYFEVGLLIYERARARVELLSELKIRLKLGLSSLDSFSI